MTRSKRRSAEDAYGIYEEELVYTVPLDEFGPESEEINIGDVFQVQNNSGEQLTVKVIEIDPGQNEITLDGNHPLADQELTFDVEIISIREASAEEIEKGHIIKEYCCDKKSNKGCC